MQKRIPALVLAAVMLITMFTGLAANAPAFNDLAGHWSEPMVTELATRGIIQGMPDGNVHPDKLVTRGEFACLVARILEMHDHTPGDPSFNDTYEHWSHQYIEALVSIGVVDSTGSLYRPEDPITRVEMTRILVAAIDRGEHAVANASSTDFKDDHLISADDKGYINIARLYKLVEGYPSNYFNPHGLSTRAEAFTIISRYDAALEIVQREGNQMAVAPDTDTVSGADSGSDTKSGTGSAVKTGTTTEQPMD